MTNSQIILRRSYVRVRWLIGLFIGLLFSACSVENPDLVAIRDFQLVELDDTVLKTTVKAAIRNPNRAGGQILSSTAEVYFNDRKVGTMRQSEPVRLPGRDVAMIPFTLNLSLPTLSEMMPEIMGSRRVAVRTEGVYKIKLGPTSLNLRRTVEDELDINDQFQDFTSSQLGDAVVFEKVHLGGMGMSQTTVNLDIKIVNPFPVPIKLTSTNIDLYFDPEGAAFGGWNYSRATEIGANSSISLDAEVDLNNKSTIIEAAKNIFGKRRVYARGTATIHFGEYPFDIPIAQDVALTKALGF